MATEDDKIKYSDIVSPDDSITKLITQLEELAKQYESMITSVKIGAKKIEVSMKSVSGATKEGRAAIDENAAAATRLEKAMSELKFALSDTGKNVAWLKERTKEVNAATVEQRKITAAMTASYDKLRLELQQNIKLWKSMSEEQRLNSAEGGAVLDNIHNLQAQLKSLDSELKLHVNAMTEVQKAEQKLNFLRSEEGQKLLQLKREINEVIAASRTQKITTDDLTEAQNKLYFVQSYYYRELQNVNRQISEQSRITKLTEQVNNSAIGSYNQLAAQYELNKIKLNSMSQEQRRAANEGQKLEAETKRIYQQMIFLQESVGDHRLSIGNYAKAWNGLGNAMNQIVRELPAATMGVNMFFLAISNNVPILIDEIQRVKRQNELLRAEGKATQSIIGTITKSIFSWQTALIMLLTVMSMHGKEILEWVSNLFTAKNAVISTAKAMDNINDELEKTNANYGQNIVSLKKLQTEWNNLTSDTEREKWIKNVKSEFSKLGIAVNSVNEAENILNKNTEAVVAALRLRAKAAAAQKLAAEQYEKALRKQNEAETEAAKGPSVGDWIKKRLTTSALYGGSTSFNSLNVEYASRRTAKGFQRERVRSLEEEARAAEKTADAYFDIADSLEKTASATLKNAGIKDKNLYDRTTRTRRGREPRDLTDTINRNDISIQKKYEESITKLQNDEYIKRRFNLLDSARTQIRELQELYRKNETYMTNPDGKFKALTDEQKQQIQQQQQWIKDIVLNIQTKLNYDLSQLEKERQLASLITMRETVDWRIDIIEDSINKEKTLRLRQLDEEEALIKKQNRLAGDAARDEAEITAEYAKKRIRIIADFDSQILELRKADVDAQLEVVKRGSQEELKLLLRKNEIERQLALSANRAKPAAQQQSEAQINQSFDKKATTVKTNFQMTGFDQQQAVEAARFNVVKHSESQITKFKLQQEKARLEEQIRLAESGALEWSDKQIEAAKYTAQGIDRELSELNNVISKIGKKGLGYTLLESLGLDDDQIKALIEATNIVIEQLQDILDAEVELAEQAVEAANKRVEAAKSAYDAEVEARNNGYANNVATAKKELEQEKKQQLEKQKILEAAQKRQENLQTLMQTNSLITAAANLWSSLSPIPVIGHALAIAAIATMFTSFAAAKIKAKQVTSASEEYGEGGLEFLEGGSHASGNDIDLHTKNKHKKNMRAEGGEALAIINKRQTKKYKKVLPGVIDSLNKGTFEDKYMNAFNKIDGLELKLQSQESNIDLSKLEREVSNIRKQNEMRLYTLPNGDTVIINGNVKRIIKH